MERASRSQSPPGGSPVSIRTQKRKGPPTAQVRPRGVYYAAALAILIAALWAYAPALRGPFLYDDFTLPFLLPQFQNQPLPVWIAGVRPFLMFTFWLSYSLFGQRPFPYHVLSLLLHLCNGFLVFWIARRILKIASIATSKLDFLAGFAAALFVLHPLQTESVSYIASRSENLSGFFFLGAFAVYLYRSRPRLSWPASAAVIMLFGAAFATKEHTIALPALLLLTDYFWDPARGSGLSLSLQGIRRNRRVYVLLLAACGLAALKVFPLLRAAPSAGFSLPNLRWHEYFFTQCRVVLDYLRLFFVPTGQNFDYDVAISRSLFEHGSLFGLLTLVVLGGGAIFFRLRFPLACYGLLVFCVLLAPTSSFLPIKDPEAEHRMYLPILGLLFVAVDLLNRLRISHRALVFAAAGVLLAAASLTYDRNQVWGDEIALWRDTAAKSPRKVRPYPYLAYALMRAQRCREALRILESAANVVQPEYTFLVSWANAYDCVNQPEKALAKLRQAAELYASADVYELMGTVYGKQGKAAESLEAYEHALKLDPNSDNAYVARGHWHAAAGELQAAMADYRRALALNPANQIARESLEMVERQSAAR